MAEKKVQKLDAEWVTLIKEAKSLGLTLEDIREFLKKKEGCDSQAGNPWSPLSFY